VDKAKHETFDLLLLDMKLPHLNGLQVYRRIKALQPDQVTIIITGYMEEMRRFIDQTLKKNAYTCLAKPFKLEKLVALLDEINKAQRKGRLSKKDG
jgi:DNA-binding NtrC family response regulator